MGQKKQFMCLRTKFVENQVKKRLFKQRGKDAIAETPQFHRNIDLQGLSYAVLPTPRDSKLRFVSVEARQAF
jgi:hypothetical protein